MDELDEIKKVIAKDGGPIAPILVKISGQAEFQTLGMTTRDWFAGMALKGLLSGPDRAAPDIETEARWAYDYADAMLAERENRKDEAKS